VIPDCVRTDLFPFPWIDRVENAYRLSFGDETLANLFMVDVFHHLRYPGAALQEFWWVLRVGGRLILLEPALSILGYLIYGLLHPEWIGRLIGLNGWRRWAGRWRTWIITPPRAMLRTSSGRIGLPIGFRAGRRLPFNRW